MLPAACLPLGALQRLLAEVLSSDDSLTAQPAFPSCGIPTSGQ